MNNQEEKDLLEMARYVLSSKTKYADMLKRLVDFYYDNLDTAPPLPEEKPKACDVLAKMKEANKKLEKMTRNLYEDRTGQKWRPQLRVIPGGGNTTPITSIVTRHKPTR
jgi:hypothetical protein